VNILRSGARPALQPHRGIRSALSPGRRDREHVARLDPEVELLAHGGGEAPRQIDGSHGARPAGLRLQRAGDAADNVQVALDDWSNVRALDLHDHVGARMQAGPVYLGDGGGRKRRRVELGEHRTGRRPKLPAEHLFHLLPGGWRDLLLQPAQLVDELRGQQVAPRGQQLTELDEGDPGLLQRQPQGTRQLGAPRRRVGLQAAAATNVGDQAVADGDGADLGIAPCSGQPVTQRA